MATAGGGSGGAANAIRAGKAVVTATLDDAGFKGQLEAFKKHLAGVGKTLAIGGGTIAAAGASIAGPIGGFFHEAVERINSFRKASEQLNTSTDIMSKLGYAAEKAGVDLDGLVGAGRKIERVIGAGLGGNKAAVKALNDLGLTAEELQNLPLDEKFKAIAEGLSKIKDPALQQQAAFQILGRSGVQLLPVLRKGSEGLQEMFDKAELLGQVIKPEDAAQAKTFTAALGQAKKAIMGIYEAIGASLLPSADRIKEISDRFIIFASRVRGFVEENRSAIATAFAVGAALIGVGTAVAGVGGAIAALGFGISGIVAGFSAIATTAPIWIPIVAAVALLVGFFYVMEKRTGLVTQMWKDLKELWDDIGPTIEKSMQGIGTALSLGEFEDAWKIATKGLEIVWLTLVDRLKGAWETLIEYVKLSLIDVEAQMKKQLPGFITGGDEAVEKQKISDMKKVLGDQDNTRRIRQDEIDRKKNDLSALVNEVNRKKEIEENTKIFRDLMNALAKGTGPMEKAAAGFQQAAAALEITGSAQGFSGRNASAQFGLGAGVKKSEETKELEKANQHLGHIEEDIAGLGLNFS